MSTNTEFLHALANTIIASDEAQLQVGIEEELEHTDNREVAEEIARDHLKEDPEYYTKLKQCGLTGKG